MAALLRSPAVLGALVACLSVAMLMAVAVEAQEPEEAANGLAMLRRRANPVSAEEFLRAELDIEKATKEVEKINRMTDIMKGVGGGAMGASAVSMAIAGALGYKDGNSQEGLRKKTKFAALVAALLFLGGTATSIASDVLQRTKAKKMGKELELASQKSDALKAAMMASLPDETAEDEILVSQTDDGFALKIVLRKGGERGHNGPPARDEVIINQADGGSALEIGIRKGDERGHDGPPVPSPLESSTRSTPTKARVSVVPRWMVERME